MHRIKHILLALGAMFLLFGCAGVSCSGGRRHVEAAEADLQRELHNKTEVSGRKTNSNDVNHAWIERICLLATICGGIAIFAAIPLAIWVDKKLAAQVAVLGVTTVLLSRVVVWINNHPGLLISVCAAIIVLAILIHLYIHRKDFEKYVNKDLDGDGQVNQ